MRVRMEKRTSYPLAALLAAWILVFNYGVSDNIGYSNLEKKYEKTYAYCVRLLDRIEQDPRLLSGNSCGSGGRYRL